MAICISLSVILLSEKFEKNRRNSKPKLIQLGKYQYPNIQKEGVSVSEEDTQELQVYHQLRLDYNNQKENVFSSKEGFFGRLVFTEEAGKDCIIWHIKMYHIAYELMLHLPIENVEMTTLEGTEPINVLDVPSGAWVLVTYTNHDLLNLRHGASNCSFEARVEKIVVFENENLVAVQQIIPVDPFYSTYFMSLNQRLAPLKSAVNLITRSEDGSGRGSILSLQNEFQYGEPQGWFNDTFLSSYPLYLGKVKEVTEENDKLILRLYQLPLTLETSAEFVIITTKHATEKGEMPTFFSSIFLEKFLQKEKGSTVLLGTFDWANSEEGGNLLQPHDIVVVEVKNKDNSSATPLIANNVFVRRLDESFIQQNSDIIRIDQLDQ